VKDIENAELYNRMHGHNPPMVIQHYKGDFYISPKIALVAGGKIKQDELVVYSSGKSSQIFVSTLERFFGKTETGEFRFTEFNV
jgi:hypothetical protein